MPDHVLDTAGAWTRNGSRKLTTRLGKPDQEQDLVKFSAYLQVLAEVVALSSSEMGRPPAQSGRHWPERLPATSRQTLPASYVRKRRATKRSRTKVMLCLKR